MNNQDLLKKVIELARIQAAGELTPALAAEFEKAAQETLRRMDYQVDPHEVKIRVSKIIHANRRMGEIYLNIRQNQEYDDLYRESRQLESEIDRIVEGKGL